jgi:hypothetical protein
MTGVVIHMLIGLLLFLPVGFIAGFIQHMHSMRQEEEEERFKNVNRN